MNVKSFSNVFEVVNKILLSVDQPMERVRIKLNDRYL